jgi:hypothetical protein
MYRMLAALVLFGISFGYVEAAVVVYLRDIYDPLRHRLHPERAPNDLFPLISVEQLQTSGPNNMRRLIIEIGREAATMLMLASIGLAIGSNLRQCAAAFFVAFGIWDIFYYIFLNLMIHWPDSLFTWDLLFLLPAPWVGPVLCPVLVSLVMIVCGLYTLRHDVRIGWKHWLAIVAGGLVIIAAFLWDTRALAAGAIPTHFPWPVFAAGLLISILGFLAAASRPGFPESRTPRDS